MTLPRPEIQGVSIVLVGSFNPTIFQPAWFAAQGLISDDEAEDAKIDVVHSEVAAYSLEWLNVQVIRERFSASTAQSPSFEVLRDFVLGTFTVLHHTPVTMLGLNFDRHYRVSDEAAWHEIGQRLASPEHWTPALQQPGMRSLTMEGTRPDGKRGAIRVRVEPSVQIRFGVYVNLNDHYELSAPDQTVVSADAAVTTIRDQWQAFLAMPDQIAGAVFGEHD